MPIHWKIFRTRSAFRIIEICLIALMLGSCGGGGGGSSSEDGSPDSITGISEDETVTDQVTGLMWQSETSEEYTWYEASGNFDPVFNPNSIDVCGSLELSNYTDWRLPERKELFSIVDYSSFNPAIDVTVFPQTLSDFYWSNTPYIGNSDWAWAIYFLDGSSVPNRHKKSEYLIRCVRGSIRLPDYTENLNATVTDNVTALMWQQVTLGIPRTWSDALLYCDSLALAGFSDWRLPTTKELWSIVDESSAVPAIDPVFSLSTVWDYYWSSTERLGFVSSTTDAWPVNFFDGKMENWISPKSDLHYVRCARNSTGDSGSLENIVISPTMVIHADTRVVGMTIDYAAVDDRIRLEVNEMKTLTNEIYQYFDDNFDIIIFVSNNQGSDGRANTVEYSGTLHPVRNDVSGTGESIFNTAADFGSMGKLKGVMHLSAHGFLQGGPSLHEIAHLWGNNSRLIGKEKLENGTITNSFHWQFTSAGKAQGGQLGGFSLDSLTFLGGNLYSANNGKDGSAIFGTFANGGNSVPYSDLELYLMGMKSAGDTRTQLPTVTHFPDGESATLPGEFTSVIGPQTVTFDEYQVDLGGPRIPDSNTSQKSFRVLTVLLDTVIPSHLDLALISEEVLALSFPGDDGNFSLNFFEATRGIGQLEASGIDADLK